MDWFLISVFWDSNVIWTKSALIISLISVTSSKPLKNRILYNLSIFVLRDSLELTLEYSQDLIAKKRAPAVSSPRTLIKGDSFVV